MLPLALAADSVRQLSVAIVLLTNSFNKTLTTAEIERVHEEVAEFYAFYQRHGAGKVDFEFSLVQIDRQIQRREIAEVSPNRYYLSRENLEAELAGRGFRGRFDEVVVLHAWSNANPERAVQAYGGGAVGPDGKFLGDAGFNSIPVMARDPNTIGQVLIHEVLHNLADMFTRSGMPEQFFNADEMSRNMAQLLREKPGAFLPRYTDEEMLRYAERERQGREAYPWAMQLVYYAWMLERTPRESWNRLRYGRMAERETMFNRLQPLYSTIYTSAANERIYAIALGGAPGDVLAGGNRLTTRTYTQGDFDGTAISTGSFLAGWASIRADRDSQVVPVTNTGGVNVGTRIVVVRQRVASVVAPVEATQYLDEAPRPVLSPRVVEDRQGGAGTEVRGAAITTTGHPTTNPPTLGIHDVSYAASAAGYYVHPARTRLVVRRSWAVSDDGPLTVNVGAPVLLSASVRESRPRENVTVTAVLPDSSRLPLSARGEGRFAGTIPDGLPPGLHWVRLVARGADGSEVIDSTRVYVRPAAWLRVPAAYALRFGDSVVLDAQLWGRMGADLPDTRLPLVAIVGDVVTPFTWWREARAHRLDAAIPRGTDRLVVASLAGGVQRRPVTLADLPARRPTGPRPARDPIPLPVHHAAMRLASAPVIDGDPGDWPAGAARGVTLNASSFLLTEPAQHHGDADLSARVRLAWDDSTLYVAGEVTDDSVVDGDTWEADRVNLVFDMNDDTTPLSYESANPPLDKWQDDDYWLFWRSGGTAVRRYGKSNLDPVPGARLATRRTPTGWSFEVAIPRSALPGFLPFVGRTAGLQLFITDGDGAGSASELMWQAKWPYTADGIEWRLAELGRLLFVDAPIPRP